MWHRRLEIILVAISLAAASVSAQTIRCCVAQTGALRLVGANDSCRTGETTLTWNTVGPQGPAGPAGPAGPQGPVGPQGPAAPADPPPAAIGVFSANGIKESPIYEYGGGNLDAIREAGTGEILRWKYSDVTIVREFDADTTKLLDSALRKLEVKQARIVFGTSIRIELRSAFVVNHETVRLPGSGKLFERLTFTWDQMTIDSFGAHAEICAVWKC